MREFKKEKLNVKVFEDRPALGAAAAETFTKKVAELLESKEYVNVIFASAPSQNEFLAELN